MRPPEGFNNSHASSTTCASEEDPKTGTNIDEKFISNVKIQVFLAAHHGQLGLTRLQF